MVAMILDFIARMAWPTVAACALFYFQTDLKSFLVRVQRAKFGSVEFETEERVRQVLAQAIEISTDLTPEKEIGDGLREPINPQIAAALPTPEGAPNDRYASIVQLRNEIYLKVQAIATATNVVSDDAATRAPMPWLLQRLRMSAPELSREFDAVGRILSAADDVLRDPSVSESAVGELIGAAKLVLNSLTEKSLPAAAP